MKKKLITCGLLLAIFMPSVNVFADSNQYTSEGFGKGDYSYEDGLYLPALHSYGVRKGRQVHPFGESKVGKISRQEKLEVLKRPKVRKLIDAYNGLYQVIIKWYKYGDRHIDRWKEVKNMTDPVFSKLNKTQWINIYQSGAKTLQRVRDYFDRLGLVDDDFTGYETLNMIDRSDLSFERVVTCGEENQINFNEGVSSRKFDAELKDLRDKDLLKVVDKILSDFNGYKMGKISEVMGKSKASATYDQRLFIQTHLLGKDSEILFQMAGKDGSLLSDYGLKNKKLSKIDGQDMVLSSYKEGDLFRAEFKNLDMSFLIETSGIYEDEFLWMVKKINKNIGNIQASSSIKFDF